MSATMRAISFWILSSGFWIPAFASDCTRTSTGLKPLPAPFFGTYHGMSGGLYPNGSNRRPAAHETSGLAEMAKVRPRASDGSIDDRNGKIVLLSIGMSNATQEFSTFKPLADRDPQKNPLLAIVDGAQGGWSADRIVASGDAYWAVVEQRLAAAGVSDAQVEVVWMKNADAMPTLSFPADAKKLQSELQNTAQTLRSRYPNLRLLYHSSRIYAGYASSNLNPEPFAYDGGFSVKWLIEDQINGNPDLSFGAGKAPWMAWGPYLWADGVKPNTDGLTWSCSDLQDDGTHPSPAGQQKVARMLLDFFKSDTTTRPWFVAASAQVPKTPAAAAMVNAAGFFPVAAPGGIATLFGSDLASTTAAASALPLPYGLAGTSVVIGGEFAPIYYVSPGQINLVVPPAGMDNSVVVFREGMPSNALAAQLAVYSEGIFTLNGNAAAALHADGRLITAADPALHGETIELFGTGMGVRNPLILAPVPLPVVRVGGPVASVTYYGFAPGFPGLDQINFTIPMDAPAGASVSLTIQLASFMSNTAALAVGQN